MTGTSHLVDPPGVAGSRSVDSQSLAKALESPGRTTMAGSAPGNPGAGVFNRIAP